MDKLDLLGYILVGFVLISCVCMYFKDNGFQLKCIVSGVDGNKYCVRERSKINAAADLLAKITGKCKELVEYMKTAYPDDERTKMLAKNYNPKKIMETLPTSTYTAYSENKGEKIAFCLTNTKKDDDDLIDEHTLMFVAIHELSHVCTKSVGHKSDFWDNFKFLLENAKDAGIHEPIDYSKTPKTYCDQPISDSPYFQL
jgi:hypothetical protein